MTINLRELSANALDPIAAVRPFMLVRELYRPKVPSLIVVHPTLMATFHRERHS
jgi:hypothetical protein